MKMNIYQKQINFYNFKHNKMTDKKKLLKYKILKYKIKANSMKIVVEILFNMIHKQTFFKNSPYEISIKKNNCNKMTKNNLRQMIF